MTKDGVPLIMDVDGTLIRSDLLWEGFAWILTRRPRRLLPALLALSRGRPSLKAFLARESAIDIDDLPLEPAALELIDDARAAGAKVILASAAHESQVEDLKDRVGADLAWGSDGVTNLKGSRKLSLIQQHFDEFDYVGNSLADLPLWKAARRAIAVNAGPFTLRKATSLRPDIIVRHIRTSTWRLWIRQLRPHHWAKNALLFVPALAAHLSPSVELAVQLLAGFAAFSATASAVYLFNDLADLASDRAHPRKRHRPLAAGKISIPAALVAGLLSVVAAAVVAWQLSPRFAGVLAAYLVITYAYSLSLKQHLAIDVITLATLYTVRIVAGAVLVEVPLSRWFLAFSIFLFLALALAKRAVELRGAAARNATKIAGRGYRPEDLRTLSAMGVAAAAASALVYCLYITGDDVTRLYANPDLLWIGLPLFLYWNLRLWLFADRGTLQEDPVAFALKDPITYVVAALFLAVVWIAT
ncbi:MAG: UbiA family prenyltransferase [Gemmatimonadetes bacterium]|nr:UbiA family prenyltransferase [Gemmatimonadota bacterium]NIO30542.1 UbiA family prenyltransferase [Gemmatimonadota bacterium]